MAGRKSTRSSSHKSAAPSRAAPAPKTAAPPATTHQAAAPAQATPAPVIIHQTGGGGGGGFLSGVAQMAAVWKYACSLRSRTNYFVLGTCRWQSSV